MVGLESPTISKEFVAFLSSVDGDVRTKDWVLAASAYLVVRCSCCTAAQSILCLPA